ncbi:protein kinase [Novymonas esmeraldas]|uniref:Protein kinase n=1 Tax=Novymonas esmeraldas TaxID=1808958 RepID=A0AAW0F1C1_9TRYP
MSTAGRYKDVVKLGEGTYGSVYKGTEIHTGRVIAFKRMEMTSEDEGVSGAAIREISLLKELRHDNVVELLEVLFEPPKITMIFELCDCDLKRFLESRPKRVLDADTELRPILKQIFLGLEYLHSRNVVHRDMKPQNIFVNVRAPDFAALTASPSMQRSSPPHLGAGTTASNVDGRAAAAASSGRSAPPAASGNVSPWEEATAAPAAKPDQLIIKIGDLGLARVEEIPVKKYSHEAVTLWYRSPDVLMGSALYSYAVDMWSMGTIFFEMATSKVLFGGRHEDEQLLRMFWLLGSPTRETWPSMLSHPGTVAQLQRASRAAADRGDLRVGGEVFVQRQIEAAATQPKGSVRPPDLLTQMAHWRFYHNAEDMRRREESARSSANTYQLPTELWFDEPLFDEYMTAIGIHRNVSAEGVHLMRQCLHYEPKYRVTAAAAVQDPYMSSVSVPTAGALDVLMTSLLQTMNACKLL